MGFVHFITRLLARHEGTRNLARERLRLVLMHDRGNDLPPGFLEALKEDLLKVISEYLEIDENALEVSFSSYDNTVALVVNMPVLRIKKAPAGQTAC